MDRLDDEIAPLARSITANSSFSHAANKRLLDATEAHPLDAGLQWEVLQYEGTGRDAAHRGLCGQGQAAASARLRAAARLHLLAARPNAKIAVLYQNDDYGKDYLQGLKAGLGKPLVAQASYEQTDTTMDSQILTLKATGADVVLLAAYPKQVTQALRKMIELGWKPEGWIAHVSAQVHPTLSLIGLDKVVGVMSAAVIKDPTDPTWQNDADFKNWLAWMKKYQPKGDIQNSCNTSVYASSAAIAHVLKLAGNDLSREGIMKAVWQLEDYAAPMLLPGVTMTISRDNCNLFHKIQLTRFDGQRWVALGAPVGD